jgi:hypothetical protein
MVLGFFEYMFRPFRNTYRICISGGVVMDAYGVWPFKGVYWLLWNIYASHPCKDGVHFGSLARRRPARSEGVSKRPSPVAPGRGGAC